MDCVIQRGVNLGPKVEKAMEIPWKMAEILWKSYGTD
jgi:hypothetical protein